MNIFKSKPEKDLTEEGRRQRKAGLALFVRSIWPDLMKMEPAKTEPLESPEIVALRDSWCNDLSASGQIVNPYVPLAQSNKPEWRGGRRVGDRWGEFMPEREPASERSAAD